MTTGASVHRTWQLHWGLLLPGICCELSVICTRVSVRRRDRCTCTALIRFALFVGFCCTPLLLSVLISLRALLGSCALCSSSALSVLPLFRPACVSALLCCGSCLCLSCLPCPAVGLIFVLWSSLHPGVLVPPSGYLVAAVTALLPCFHAGSVVKLCYPSVIRFMATKATSPVWGFYPLHHVTGYVGELSSAMLRYSSE